MRISRTTHPADPGLLLAADRRKRLPLLRYDAYLLNRCALLAFGCFCLATSAFPLLANRMTTREDCERRILRGQGWTLASESGRWRCSRLRILRFRLRSADPSPITAIRRTVVPPAVVLSQALLALVLEYLVGVGHWVGCFAPWVRGCV